eukprot:evm.model.scf_4967.1 EVM.evm.TU.scf_4967.1   scf_4967:986-2789(-)
MRALLAVAVAVLGLLAVDAAEMNFTVCKDAPFMPSSVTLAPYPPHPGTEVLFQIVGVADHNMTGGKFEAEVSVVEFGFDLPVYEESKDLCTRTKCPIMKGNVTFTYDKTLPSVTPAGTYHVKLDAKDLEGNLEMCLELDFEITLPTADEPEDESVLDVGTLKLGWQGVERKAWQPEDRAKEEPQVTYVY